MVDFALGLFAITVMGSIATVALAFTAIIGIAVVEWVKYRREQ